MRRLLFLVAMLAAAAVAAAGALAHGKPGTETAYAGGQSVTIAAVHSIVNPSPSHLAHANDLYIAAYPWDTTPPTFASGYVPICDPCYHPGLPDPFVYHDHVLSGAPRLGDTSAPRHLILVLYKSSVLTDPRFVPAKSIAQIRQGEQDSPDGLFQVINPGGDNPYEIDTGELVVSPVVSPHA